MSRIDTPQRRMVLAVGALAVIGMGVVGGCSSAVPTAATEQASAWDAAPGEYRDAIIVALSEHGCPAVDKSLVAAQFRVESGFRADAVSAAGAVGPAQISPAILERYRAQTGVVDIRRPLDSARVLVSADCAHAGELAAKGIPVLPGTIAQAWVGGVDSAATVTPPAQQIVAEMGQ